MSPPPAGSKNVGRSPYIVFYPQFSSSKGYTEYAVDFQIDHAPAGTYLALLDWSYDVSALKKQYASVYADYRDISGYCGLQVWEDGRHAIIFTQWIGYGKDRSGQVTEIVPTALYPADSSLTTRHGTSSGEGSFVHTMYEYDWKVGHPYRLMLQTGTSPYTGNTTMAMWICDLTTGRWDRLVEYDTSMKDTWIKNGGAGFFENYVVATADQRRTCELWNFRAHERSSERWISAKKVKFTVNNSMDASDFNYTGSYNYGSDDQRFWIITSGWEGLCALPKNGKVFSVKTCETGSPY